VVPNALLLVADDEHDAVHARGRDGLDDVFEQRSVRHGDHRLRPPVRQRREPPPLAGGEDHRGHGVASHASNVARLRFKSLADVHVSPATDAIEVRLPWLLLNVADPSRRRRLGDFRSEGLDAHETFEAIDVAAASYAPAGADGTAAEIDAETNLTHAVPGGAGGRLRSIRFAPPTWDRPAYTERLKESGRIVGDAFGRYADRE